MSIKSISMLFLLINTFLFSQQTAWEWQNPIPMGNSINKISFADPNTGYAALSCGTIIKSTNGGNNWFGLSVDENYHYNFITFLNSSTGFVTASTRRSPPSYRLFNTTNGGANWTGINVDTASAFVNVIFANRDTLYSCDYNNIFKSTNGGLNWFFLYNIGSTIRALYCQNPRTILFSYYDQNNYTFILKSTTGGIDWNGSIIGRNLTINSISFADNNNGIAVGRSTTGYGYILQTTNSGYNWYPLDSTFLKDYKSIQFVNQQTGYIFNSYYTPSSYSTILKSTNSGSQWNEILNSQNSYSQLYFTNINTGYLLQNYSGMYKTSNGGSNWFSGNLTTKSLYGASYLDQNNVYAVGSGGAFIKTTNTGINWTYKTIDSTCEFYSVSFVNSQTGFVSGARVEYPNSTGIVYKTTDSGNNWFISIYPSGFLTRSLYFINSNTGFLVDALGAVAKTTNSGLNWQSSYSVSGRYFYHIQFLNDNTGYFSGSQGVLYKTTNCGVNWINRSISTNNHIRKIQFLNELTGYALGTDPDWAKTNIFRTTDGGLNWSSALAANNARMWSMHFFNDSTAFIAGENGISLRTTDFGNSWYSPQLITCSNLNSIIFLNENTGFIHGDNGIILKTTTGGLTAINQNISVSPESFSLSQNYPNPFNPVTNIKFDIPKSGLVKITVFDLLGRELTTLVNEQMQPGSYNVDWDASNYPSGVYFYRLEAGDPSTGSPKGQTGRGFVESKKMVLVK